MSANYGNKTYSYAELSEAQAIFTSIFNNTGKKINLDMAAVHFLVSLKLTNFEKKPHPALTCVALHNGGLGRCTNPLRDEDLVVGIQMLLRLCKLPDVKKKTLLTNGADLIAGLKNIARIFHCNKDNHNSLDKVTETATVDFLRPVQVMFAQVIFSSAGVEAAQGESITATSSTDHQHLMIDNGSVDSLFGEIGGSGTADCEMEEGSSLATSEDSSKEGKIVFTGKYIDLSGDRLDEFEEEYDELYAKLKADWIKIKDMAALFKGREAEWYRFSKERESQTERIAALNQMRQELTPHWSTIVDKVKVWKKEKTTLYAHEGRVVDEPTTAKVLRHLDLGHGLCSAMFWP